MRVNDNCPSRLIAIDPGDHTGIAVCTRSHDATLRIHTYSHGWRDPVVTALKSMVPGTEKVIVEQYITRPSSHKAGIEIAPRVVGVVEAITTWPVIYQQASDIKVMVCPKLIKRVGWTWQTAHELDALRHLYYYLAINRYVTFERDTNVSNQ